MGSMKPLRVTSTDAVGISAAARSFREAALDHGIRGAEETFDEPLPLLTHHLILRYATPFLLSREK